MPSNALTIHLEQVLDAATELNNIHFLLRTNDLDDPNGLAALDLSIVVMTISAWESFIEELLREALQALQPIPPSSIGHWPALSAFVLGEIGRFNTPNAQNVTNLFNRCLGLVDVSDSWQWPEYIPDHARTLLNAALQNRHQIAHGVNPRPEIHNIYSAGLIEFIRRLAECTDAAVRDHLVNVHRVTNPWPV